MTEFKFDCVKCEFKTTDKITALNHARMHKEKKIVSA